MHSSSVGFFAVEGSAYNPIEMASSSHAQEAEGQEQPCYLGSLAPEIIDNILSEVDSIRDLANFITTSPVIYRRFEVRKRPILSRVLQTELGPVLTDARFLNEFPYSDPGEEDEKPAYWDMIHTKGAEYRGMLAAGPDADDIIPSLEELTKLCRTLHTMTRLANTYLAAQPYLFGNEGPATPPPSRAERLRVVRAFYRRQIVLNAYAPTKRQRRWVHEDIAALSNTSEHQGVRLGLLATFEFWEQQQIDHVNHFVTQFIPALHLAEAAEGNTITIPASADLLAAMAEEPKSKVDWGVLFSHTECLARYLREHPSLADVATRALPLMEDHFTFKEEMTLPQRKIYEQSLLPLGNNWQCYRIDRLPDPAMRKRILHHVRPIYFVGDAVELPPFGWTDATGEREVNMIGEAWSWMLERWLPEDRKEKFPEWQARVELWRGAGFTLWDRQRVLALKELETMKSLRKGWVFA